MKKTKRFTAVLLAAVLLGGCGSENNTNTLEYRSEGSNDTKSEYVDSEEISEKLDEVKDILGEEYRFDENNYILCQATNEEEKEEVSVNIYCDDKYEIGATCFNLAIPVIQSYCGSNFNIGFENREDTLMYIVVSDVVISDERPLFDETDEDTMKLAGEFIQFLEDYFVSSGFSKNESSEENKPIEEKIPKPEIVFREIPWGTSFPDVDENFASWDLWNISGDGYKTCSVDDILIGDYEGIDFEYSGINVISSAFNGEQDVAGYKTTDIELYFAFLPSEEGYLTYDEKDTALYGAKYTFEPVDLEDMYNDLTEKLTNLYGEPDKVTYDTDLWDNKYTYTYWYGANNTELVLRGQNTENDTTDLNDDEIYITYAWREGDNLLKSASDAIKKEKRDKEKEAQGNGDANGL